MTRTVQTQPAQTAIPQVSVTDTTAEDRLLDFVEKQIEKMRKYATFTNGQPTFFELNEALCGYGDINCSFISLDVLAKNEYQKAKNEYDEFIAEKYSQVRKENNLQSLSAQKWLSTQELMYLVQSDPRWVMEYRKLRDEMNAAEKKVAFCRRMLDNLESLKFTLNTLSKNVIAESVNVNYGQLQ